jgi:hypothetical protein
MTIRFNDSKSSARFYDSAIDLYRREVIRERTRLQAQRLSEAGRWRRFLIEHGLEFNANNPLFYDTPCITGMNAMTALMNSGTMRVYTGAQPSINGAVTGTLLVTLTFGATAFATATASAGTVTATANTITSGTAGNTGTAGYFALIESNGTSIFATGSVGTSGADLNLTTLSIVATAVVTCSAFSITQSEA